MKNKAKTDKHRLHLQVPDGTMKLLNDLQTLMQLPTQTATVQRSLIYCYLLVGQVANGGKVILEDKAGKQEVMKVI